MAHLPDFAWLSAEHVILSVAKDPAGFFADGSE